MKFAAAAFVLAVATPASLAFAPTPFGVRPGTCLQAEIRGPTEKSQELRFGKGLVTGHWSSRHVRLMSHDMRHSQPF
jgi:hypothetical protein